MINQLNKRFAEVRKSLGISMTKYGEPIDLTNPTISLIEKGHRSVTDRTIKAVVREYGVSEHWLRTGEGEMFKPKSTDGELAPLIGALIREDTKYPEFKKRFIINMLELDDSQWEIVQELVLSLADTIKKTSSD